MGLGLLAGAGALVDYWPTDVRVPHPPTINVRPALARALALPATPAPIAVANLEARRLRPVMVSAVLSTASFTASAVEISLPPPPAVSMSTFDVVPAVATIVPAQQVGLSLPPSIETPDQDSVAPLRQFSGGENPSDPPSADGTFLTGAFRVAGDSLATAGGSIVSAGVKTGQSVAGAFRAAAGAVKKIKFF
jgi:hypothetical protein